MYWSLTFWSPYHLLLWNTSTHVLIQPNQTHNELILMLNVHFPKSLTLLTLPSEVCSLVSVKMSLQSVLPLHFSARCPLNAIRTSYNSQNYNWRLIFLLPRERGQIQNRIHSLVMSNPRINQLRNWSQLHLAPSRGRSFSHWSDYIRDNASRLRSS